MQQNQELIEYVQSQLRLGCTQEQISYHLRQYGWDEPSVQRAFLALHTGLSQEQGQLLVQQAPKTEGRILRKYGVFAALKGASQAIIINYPNFSLLGMVLFTGFWMLVYLSPILSSLLMAIFKDSIIGTVVACLLMLAGAVSAGSILITVFSVPIFDGASGRVPHYKQTLQLIISRWFRVFCATWFTFLYAIWPLALILSIGLIGRLTGIGGSSLGVAIMILSSITTVYVLIHSVFYWALAPYIAMFETETPITQIPQRSKYLMKKGGIWFLIKGSVIYALTSYILSGMLYTSLREGSEYKSVTIFTIISGIIAWLMANAVLVMLYRWRTEQRD